MDPAKTPPRGEDVDEPDMPLSDRMAKFQDELRGTRLLDKVTPGYPKLIAPNTIAQAFDLANAAKADKAKENVSVGWCFTWSTPVVFCIPSVIVGVSESQKRTHPTNTHIKKSKKKTNSANYNNY